MLQYSLKPMEASKEATSFLRHPSEDEDQIYK